MGKLLLKGVTPKEGSERECRNRGVIITITLNCNALHFHIFTVIQNTATGRTGSDYLNTQCTVSPPHKCLELLVFIWNEAIDTFLQQELHTRKAETTQIRGWSFPKAAVWKDYKQLIPYTWIGFLARGNPSEIRNGDVKRFSWGDGGQHPGCL